MATGRSRRRALRGATALVLGCLAGLGGLVAFAPGASADPSVTVEIKDLTPPLVSVDANGTVTFVDAIADKTVQVGGGGLLPSLVTVVVHTDVTLGIPDVEHPIPLQPGQQVDRTFAQSCLTCTITYAYRATVADKSVVGGLLATVTGKAVAAMPQSQVVTYNGQPTTVAIGVPTPFLVNTLVPLPNLPSVNLPQLPPVTVPAPGGGGAVPAPVPGGGGSAGGTTTIVTQRTTTVTTQRGIDGSQYAYDTGTGAPQMAPLGGAAPAFDGGSTAGGDGSGSGAPGRYLAGGAGGNPGASDAASVPAIGLDGAQLADAGASSPAGGSGDRSSLPVPALVAVLALAGVCAGLVRTVQLRSAARR